MPKIKFIEQDGNEVFVDIPVGDTVMQAAMDNMIEGIVAECGGACSCATCQVYVDESWIEKVGMACEMEQDMLAAGSNVMWNSRLSCQIEMDESLDGLVVRVPAEQG